MKANLLLAFVINIPQKLDRTIKCMIARQTV